MSQSLLTSLILGLALSLLIAFLAYRRQSLSRSGAIGALIVGTLIFGLGGWVWGIVLVVFFVSSSLLSHFREREKMTVAEKFEKGGQRDFGQTMANGGLGALIAILSAIVPQSVAPNTVWFFLFLGVMATVTADTWATELGTLSRNAPRLVTNGRTVEVGTSGGVSPLGTGVSFVGGLLIGLVAGVFGAVAGLHPWSAVLWISLIGALSGAAGSLIDSLMGATIQQIYYCDTCQKETERKIHRCGTATRPLRGWAWLNNDLVNLLSSFGGGLVAVLLMGML